MKALLVEWTPKTGERAGGINPRNNHNMSPCWQDPEAGLEIRFVRDGNVEPYRDVDGITVLETSADLDAALAEHVKTDATYTVHSEALLSNSIVQKHINTALVPHEWAPNEQYKAFYELGALGIQRVEPEIPTAADLCKQWGIPLDG